MLPKESFFYFFYKTNENDFLILIFCPYEMTQIVKGWDRHIKSMTSYYNVIYKVNICKKKNHNFNFYFLYFSFFVFFLKFLETKHNIKRFT